jgi:hypothetical protein
LRADGVGGQFGSRASGRSAASNGIRHPIRTPSRYSPILPDTSRYFPILPDTSRRLLKPPRVPTPTVVAPLFPPPSTRFSVRPQSRPQSRPCSFPPVLPVRRHPSLPEPRAKGP